MRSASRSRPYAFPDVLVALFVLATFTLQACTVTRAVALKDIQADFTKDRPVRIWTHRSHDPDWQVYLVTAIDYPFVWAMPLGRVTGPGNNPDKEASRDAVLQRIEMTDFDDVQVYSQAGSAIATLAVTLGVLGGTLALLFLIIALTKTSCPFVYVEGSDGRLDFVGEAYSGATGFATARDDLLPLPPMAPGARRIVLANEADETQYTDLAELYLVEHAGDTRALATFDARAILVGDAQPPTKAVDLDGTDVLSLVQAADGSDWRTDLALASERRPEPVREGLELRFTAPQVGTAPVLELDLGNTPWLDIVFGRFFAVAGDKLESLQKAADDPANGPARIVWRDREGVDLRVEMLRRGIWERVANVPTPGPVSRRRLAVPLPAPDGPEIAVRISGGVGFWRVDRAALSPLVDGSPVLTRLAATVALQSDGSDARSLVAAGDHRPQILQNRGDRLELRFEVPAVQGQRREAFLRTHGWYHVHRPLQARFDLGRARVLRDQAGSLSRFGLELWRDYEAASVAAAKSLGVR